MPKLPTVSIVIPAYNEESSLRACLDAIAKQTVKPLEVIVVDNNSADATASIAESYSFVHMVREKRQGVAFARDCGFNAAKGDIIGRIDADSVISANWVGKIQKAFKDDSELAAATGLVTYRHVGLGWVFDGMDRRLRYYLSKRSGRAGEHFLYGVNMAIKRTVWREVRSRVCHERHLHEDLDLACHLSKLRRKVVLEPRMMVSVNPRQAASPPRVFWHYVWSCPRVYGEHGMKSAKYGKRIAALVAFMYLPIFLLYRGFNPRTQRFSLVYLLFSSIQDHTRVSPVSGSY